MARSSLRSKFEEHLTCSVCLEQLKDPKVLPCLHSFCHVCIVKLAKNGKSKNITCPECRKVVQIDVSHNSTNLPSNFFVNNLLATMVLADEKTAKKIVCDNCDSGDVAETRCNECGVFLCHFCTEYHKRSRATKEHKPTSMQELKSMPGPGSIAERLRCAKHTEEVIKLYCKTCQATICRDCTIVDHRTHEYGFIDDVALQEKQKLQTNLNEVKQRKVRVKQGIASLKKFDDGLVTKKALVFSEINKYFDEVAKVMDIRKRALLGKATALTASKQKQIHTQLEQLEMALASCESSIEFTELAFKNGNDAQVLSMQKYILQSLEDLKRVKDQTQPCVTEDLTFAIPWSVKEIQEKLFNSYAVDDVVASPGKCKASFNEPNADLKIGKQSSVTIVCYDKRDKRVKHGGQLIKPTISGVKAGDVTVTDNRDGSHTVKFSPRRGGVLKFEATINRHRAPHCSLTKNVRWVISNAYGSGEITNNALTMKGQDSTYCWRVGECSFESGVHTWKVRVTSPRNDHYGSLGSVEVGVTDSNEINANSKISKKWVFSTSCPTDKTFDMSLTLDMENKSLKVSSDYDHNYHGHRCYTKTYTIEAQQVSPFFSSSLCAVTLSIIE